MSLDARDAPRADAPATPKPRRFPIGAEPCDAGTHFRIFAPAASRLVVRIDGRGEYALVPEHNGYHAGLGPESQPAITTGSRSTTVRALRIPHPASSPTDRTDRTDHRW